MSLFSVLHRGTMGLVTAQFGTEVAAQNAANANTEGYSRQRALIEAVGPRPQGGVRATGSRRVVDQFLERRILGSRSYEGESNARADTMRVMDMVLADGAGSIGNGLDAFQRALSDLGAHPGDASVRTVVLERAEQLAQSFRDAGTEIATARTDTNQRIAYEVSEINRKLHEIASLGNQIADYENTTLEEAGTLRDQRDELIREVANAAPVKVIEASHGRVSLLLAGSLSLVTPDGKVNELRAAVDPTTQDVSVNRTTAGLDEDVTQLITSGRIGGYVAARDNGLTDARDELDQLAFDLATAYNATHAAGFGLDGVGGRNLFEPPTSVTQAAEMLTVSADVVGQPDNLAAATDPTATPGDNRNAIALLAVADADVALGGTATIDEGYQRLIATAGSATRDAMLQEEHATGLASQLDAMRESVSGVSTDEEMISLMQFQRAYQASLKVIQTADEMLEGLMMLKR